MLSLAFTSAPRAIRARARRRSLSQAAAINCSFSRACSFALSFAAGVLVGGELGRLVAVGPVEVADEAGCSEAPGVVESPALQDALANMTAARTAKERIGLICSGYGDTLTTVTTEPEMEPPLQIVADDDPRALEAAAAVQAGDLDALERLLAMHPWLATARFGDEECYRTLLHAATDWPGHFSNGPAVVKRLVAAGADVSAHSRFSFHTETPLHWAASSDDVAVLDALLDAGADIEAPGAVLGGGSPLADACGFGNWAVARRLVERGAHTRLSDAAALGLLDRVEVPFAEEPGPDPEVITQSFWSACHGGQRNTAEYLLERSANINWIGWDDKTPLDLVDETTHYELAAWLRARGAKHAKELLPG